MYTITRGGLGRLAAWHLPGGPVGPPARWAATSNVEIGQTTNPVKRERLEKGGKKRVEQGREGCTWIFVQVPHIF